MLIKDVECLYGIAQHLVNIFVSKEKRGHHGQIQVDAKQSHMWGRFDPLAPPTLISPAYCTSELSSAFASC